MVLQAIGHAKSYEELLVKGRHPLLMDGPFQDATGTQHAPAQEEGAGQLVIVNVLQEDQNHRVPVGLDDLVIGVMGLKSR